MPRKTTTDREAGARRQHSYHRRMREAGFVRLSIWVPEALREQAQQAIRDLVEGYDPENKKAL